MNVEADILSPDSTQKLDDYKLIVVPALYAASDAEIARLNDYAKRGGHLLYTFKSGFSDENTKVRYAARSRVRSPKRRASPIRSSRSPTGSRWRAIRSGFRMPTTRRAGGWRC